MTQSTYRIFAGPWGLKQYDVPAFEELDASPADTQERFSSAMTLSQYVVASQAMRFLGEDPGQNAPGFVDIIEDHQALPLEDGQPSLDYRSGDDFRVGVVVDATGFLPAFLDAMRYLESRPRS